MRSDRPAMGDGALADELANVQMLAERGDFSRARALCQALLHDNPQNADVHSAMGDVYASEGAWGDAVKWYELALELDFDPSVMEKLAAARGRAIRAGAAAAAGPQVAVARQAPAVTVADDEARTRKQQVVALVVVGVIIISVIVFLLMRGGGRESAEMRAAEGAAPTSTALGPAPMSGPGAAARGLSGAGAPTAGGSGSLAPPAGESRTTRYTGAPSQRSGPAPNPQGTPTEGDMVAQLYSRMEQHVLARMKLEKWRDGTSVAAGASLALDDFAGVGIITIRAPRTDDMDRLERDVLFSAFRAAAAALRADSALREVIVRCIVRLPDEQGQDQNTIVFRARATRESMGRWLGVSEMPMLDQIRGGILTQILWDRDALLRYLQQRDRPRERETPDEGPGASVEPEPAGSG